MIKPPAFFPLCIGLLGCAIALGDVPRPLSDHPGNIFVAGETVTLAAPPGEGDITLTDYDGNARTVEATGDHVELGALPIGYYELRRGDAKSRVTLGVIAPRKAETPPSSPISIDVGMAWFYKDEKTQRAAANLCRIAGINWVRDRLNWGEMEPKRGTFAAHNIYDDSARIQTESGLRILQVNHLSPPWANPDGKRFPLDLRDAYNFYCEMAKRWKGQVLAIEPWNEADIDVFGGHTGAEMASMQKASYLGLKAGNPETIACENVFAIARKSTLDDFAANDAGAYFDTYNLHHYVGFDKYKEIYALHRAASAGRPMWVTECNVTVNWADEKTHEPDDKSLHWQANRVAKVYSMAINEGAVNVFYFLLPHYVERTLQYGIIHEDLTPRPAYVALAAAGRFLCDAKPLGTFDADDGVTKGYLFSANIDGEKKLVMVAWSPDKPKDIPFNPPIEKVFDHLGREKKNLKPKTLAVSGAPIYVVMKADAVIIREQPTPKIDMQLDTPRNPIVLQPLMPPKDIALNESAYVYPPAERHELKLAAYNFSDRAASIPLEIESPGGWKITAPRSVDVQPMGRTEFTLALDPREPSAKPNMVKIHGNGAVLSFRVIDEKPPESDKK